LGPGPGEVGQGGLKVFHIWCHSQKKPQPKIFFFWVQTRRLAASLEPLKSSLPFSAPKLWTHKAMCDPVVFWREFPNPTKCLSVNRVVLSALDNLKHLITLWHVGSWWTIYCYMEITHQPLLYLYSPPSLARR